MSCSIRVRGSSLVGDECQQLIVQSHARQWAKFKNCAWIPVPARAPLRAEKVRLRALDEVEFHRYIKEMQALGRWPSLQARHWAVIVDNEMLAGKRAKLDSTVISKAAVK